MSNNTYRDRKRAEFTLKFDSLEKIENIAIEIYRAKKINR